MEEIREFNIKGIATDVSTYEWEDEDVINKAPVTVYRVSKRKGGFTLFMKGITQDYEWYFSKGLTLFKTLQGGKILKIEHEDGTYWVELQSDGELYDFLKEFILEE